MKLSCLKDTKGDENYHPPLCPLPSREGELRVSPLPLRERDRGQGEGDFQVNNTIFLNGKFLPADKALVSIFDRGFMYGDGLFETMRSYDGTIFALNLHLERLVKGAKTIGISLRQSKKYLSNILYNTLKINGLTVGNAYVKLIITRGLDCGGRIIPPKSLKPTLVIIARPLDVKRIKHYQQKGMGAVFISNKIRPVPQVKSLNLLANITGLIEANQRRMQEVIFTHGNKILEGAITNIFISDGKSLKTPPIKDGILAGITRRLVIELIKKQGIKIVEISLTIEDLKNSAEAFLTNSLMEIVPLVKIENKLIDNGQPGILTKRLQQAYKQLLLTVK